LALLLGVEVVTEREAVLGHVAVAGHAVAAELEVVLVAGNVQKLDERHGRMVAVAVAVAVAHELVLDERVLVAGSEQRLGASRGHVGELILSMARDSPLWKKVETRRLNAEECGEVFDL
jgi:hypothetical protein